MGNNPNVHCSVAYIDNNDIPEMLVCYESHHVDGGCIYTYDVDTDKVIYCGEFSSYGFFSYSERNNVIAEEKLGKDITKCYYQRVGQYIILKKKLRIITLVKEFPCFLIHIYLFLYLCQFV